MAKTVKKTKINAYHERVTKIEREDNENYGYVRRQRNSKRI